VRGDWPGQLRGDAEDCVEGVTRHVLGDHEAHPLVEAEVEYLSDVGVRERRGLLGFRDHGGSEVDAVNWSSTDPPDHHAFPETLDSNECRQVPFSPVDVVEALDEPILAKHDFGGGHRGIVS
jgi:hypothetical protein